MQGLSNLNSPVCSAVDVDDRAAPRFTLLIRTAKLVVADRQYLCVIRDISATGTSIRTFHPIKKGGRTAIQLDTGQEYPVEPVWDRDGEAGFQFLTPIDVDDVVQGISQYPRRDLRFDIEQEVKLRFAGQRFSAMLKNVSRQGGLLECDTPIALDQRVEIVGSGIPDIEARVRWRKEGRYGLIFDTTFSLANLALLVRDLHMRETAVRASSQSNAQLAD